MINLYKNTEGTRNKSKTLFSAQKSHIASTNMRIAIDMAPEITQR
jgi:hypothetical protein